MATMTPSSSSASSSSSVALLSSSSSSSPSSSSPHRTNTWVDDKLSPNILFIWTEKNSYRLDWCLWKVLVLVVPNNTTPSPPPKQELRHFCPHCTTAKLGRSPLRAQARPKVCLGRSNVVHMTFRPRHGRHLGRREISSMFKTVVQNSRREGHSKEAGIRHTHRLGRRMDAQWSAIGLPIRNG